MHILEKVQMCSPPQKQNCEMPQGRHIQHFLQRTLKRENKFKVQKLLHLFCKGVSFVFCRSYFLILISENDKKLSIQTCSHWQSCQFQTVLDMVQGEGVVFTIILLCLSHFYAVIVTGDISILLSKRELFIWSSKSVLKTVTDTQTPSWSAWSDA